MKRRTSRASGFTLIELMIVISIIATLSSIGFVRYRRVVTQAETVVSVRGLREIFEGVMQFEQANGYFPETLDELGWGPLPDTWGNPYQYLNFHTDSSSGNGNGGNGNGGSSGSGSSGGSSGSSGSSGGSSGSGNPNPKGKGGLALLFGGSGVVHAQGGGSGSVNQGAMRKDRFLVPINTWFDLYSMGPDGLSKAPLNAADSRDDIIVANDGEFIGPASEF